MVGGRRGEAKRSECVRGSNQVCEDEGLMTALLGAVEWMDG